MEPVFSSLFIALLFSFRIRPDDEPSFSLGRIECRLFHLIIGLAHACINPRNASRHCEQRTTQRVIFSIESDDQPVFLVSLPGLLQKVFESLVTAPSYFFSSHFEIINAPSRTIALTGNK